MKLTAEEQLQLGENHYHGKNEKQDFSEAAKWFRAAARKGNENPIAQYYLGVMYDNGLGVPQNARTAAKWF